MGLLRGPAGLNSDSPRAKRKRTTGRSPNERKKERGPALWLGCFSWGWLARSLLSHYAGNRQICGPATARCDEGNILKLNCPRLWASSPRASLYHELVVFFGEFSLFCLNNQNAQTFCNRPVQKILSAEKMNEDTWTTLNRTRGFAEFRDLWL